MSQELLDKYRAYFHVGGADVLDTIDGLDAAAFDALPLGAVLLDQRARIVRYNRTEGELTNRDPTSVIGLNFFLDLAVCGVSQHFQGRFKEAIKALQYDVMFPYVFHHRMPETVMFVRMAKPRARLDSPHVWVLVRRVMPPVPGTGGA
jgi:photoactive yellow protein